jgi:hypothetical protein
LEVGYDSNKKNAVFWIINAHEDLINIIKSMNGYLKTPKLDQFNDLISWFNRIHGYTLPNHPLNTSEIYSNSWLAGFIDADGSFRIHYTENKVVKVEGLQHSKKERIELSLRLEQRKILPYNGQSYKLIMKQIQSLFGLYGDLRTSKYKDKTYWIIEITSVNRLSLLSAYLNNHHLLTANRNNYDDWSSAYQLVKDGKHLTEEGKSSIKRIKSNMNRKRKAFNWAHLIYLNRVW